MKLPPQAPLTPLASPTTRPPPRIAMSRGDAVTVGTAHPERALLDLVGTTATNAVFAVAADESLNTPTRANDEAATDDASAKQREDTAADTALAPPLAEARHQLRRVGTLVGQLFRHATAQGAWSARIPVAPELLPATVLLLGYRPQQASVHFETQDWEARALLREHCRELEAFLRTQLPADFEVSVSA